MDTRYEEALERANEAVKRGMVSQNFVDDIFGVESEDERIRKRLIVCLKLSLKGAEEQDAAGCSRQKDIEAYKWGIAYLEKQKEQKPTPDWMPKFLDELRSKKNYFDWDEHRDIEGQILAIINWIAPTYFNRKEKEQKPECQDMAVLLPNGNWTELDERRRIMGLPPIDYDALASEQKEPKHEPEDLQKSFEMGQQSIINNAEKYGLCKPAEWSEEEEKKIVELKTFIAQCNGFNKANRQKAFNMIDALRPQPKQEWSEQNKKWFDAIIKDYEESLSGDEEHDPAIQIKINLLKSIRHKSLRPCPSWKPSEEQMEALNAMNCHGCLTYPGQSQLLIDMEKSLKAL